MPTFNFSNRSTNAARRSNRPGEKGFSLLELVISMVVFLIVTASIYAVLQVAQRSRSTVNQQVQLTKNVRVALNLIGRDTYNAGFGYPAPPTNVLLPNNRVAPLLGVPPDSDASQDVMTPIVVGDNRTVNTLNGSGGAATDQVSFLFKDSSFNLVGTAGNELSRALIVSDINKTSGLMTIDASSGTNALCEINDLYLITGNNGTNILGVVTAKPATDKILFSNSDVLGFNQPGNTGSLSKVTAIAGLQRVKLVTYFVTADGILTRREFANSTATPAAAYVDEPLVYGVENMQIKYVMGDGTVSDNPDAATLGSVRQIRYTISVRSNELNSIGQPFRISMSSTYSTRNLGYDAN